jgi:Protein of unknown function (DUF732)
MFSGVARHTCVLLAALITGVAALAGGTAAANPDQDQKFFDLLGQKEIPPVDNANSLIETAHKACSKLDSGMSVGDLVDLIRNNGYNENPLTRLNPADRITRTINQFIIASVEAYCPYDRGKIASIAAYRQSGSRGVIVLASLTEALPTGEIPPTKPVPVPAQPPPAPPEAPAPAPQQAPPPQPQQPPPPPRHVQQAPQRQQPEAPPPQQAPPQEAPPQVEAPQAPAPAPEPGAPAPAPAPAPESPPPAPPAPPGHIRLAP